MRQFAFTMAMAIAIPAAVQAAGPADASSPAPPPAYRSAFQDLPTGVEEQQLAWKQANADVARFPRGHADYVKWEEQQGAGAGKPPDRVAPPAAAAPGTVSPAQSPGHKHH